MDFFQYLRVIFQLAYFYRERLVKGSSVVFMIIL